MPKITKRVVDGIGEESTGKIIRDEELRGFGVRRNRDGSKTYLLEYRSGRGRSFPVRRMSIGRHGVLTPEQARNQARELLVSVQQGNDPAADRLRLQDEITIKELLERTIQSHWRAHNRKSATAFERMIRFSLIPAFGSKKVSALKRSDIREWHVSQSHRPRQANLDLSLLHKALNIALADELIDSNPASGITKFTEKARTCRLSDADLKVLWLCFSHTDVSTEAALLFRLLLLTGCR